MSHTLVELYERYGYFVHQRCLVLLRSQADADDALQEVFIRVQRYRGTERGASTLAWLYKIAGNCCFDLMRRRGSVLSFELPEGTSGGPQDADRKALLGAVLRRLKARSREIGMLHFLGGWTQEEVAEQLGISRRTVARELQIFEDTFQQLWLSANQGKNDDF